MKACIVALLVGAAMAAPSARGPAEMDTPSSMMDMEHRHADTAMTRRQTEEDFQNVVSECRTKLESAEVDSLDDCVLDSLGINRRQLEASQEAIAMITQDCADKTPGDQAAIYECVRKALSL